MEWMMLTEEERGYYERRAEKQLAMAEATADPGACASHYTLANLYLDLAYEPDSAEDLTEVA
jgi:C1A family cysteine protease